MVVPTTEAAWAQKRHGGSRPQEPAAYGSLETGATVGATGTPATAPGKSWHIGVVPSASMIIGAGIAVIWFWIPLAIFIVAISSIPSVIGFAPGGVVFIF